MRYQKENYFSSITNNKSVFIDSEKDPHLISKCIDFLLILFFFYLVNATINFYSSSRMHNLEKRA